MKTAFDAKGNKLKVGDKVIFTCNRCLSYKPYMQMEAIILRIDCDLIEVKWKNPHPYRTIKTWFAYRFEKINKDSGLVCKKKNVL